jgi:hypothetical protein
MDAPPGSENNDIDRRSFFILLPRDIPEMDPKIEI